MRTRDEHCPPHVHVEHEAARWEARLAFSFIDNVVRLMDVDPVVNAPSMRMIDRIKAAIATDLAKCRAKWWAIVGTCCIDNRWIQVSGEGKVTLLAKREAGAAQIGNAIYAPRTGLLLLTTNDGASFKVNAGDGAEQWVP